MVTDGSQRLWKIEQDDIVCELVLELVVELELGSIDADEEIVDGLLAEVLLTDAVD